MRVITRQLAKEILFSSGFVLIALVAILIKPIVVHTFLYLMIY